MNKNQIDKILMEQKARRTKILFGVVSILILAFASVFLIYLYIEHTRSYQVSYDESSDVSYNVSYFNNDFLDNSQEQGKQYIASLIDKIAANFKYNAVLDIDNANYQYTYRVEANTVIKDKISGKAILDNTDVLVEPVTDTSSSSNLDISQNVSIDYQHYNDIANRLVSFYELESVESTLSVNFYIKVSGSCDEAINSSDSEKVISLNIPLTDNTIGINIEGSSLNTTNNILLCNRDALIDKLSLIAGCILAIITLIVIIYVIKFTIRSRSAEDIYMRELKHILNNYGSYIQEISNNFRLKGCQIVKIKTFSDILEIHDTVKQPILMRENRDQRSAYFLVPTGSKLVYVFKLDVNEIKSKMSKKNKVERKIQVNDAQDSVIAKAQDEK